MNLTHEQLAHLSKQDLRRLKAQIDLQLATGTDPVSRDGMMVWQALRSAASASRFNTVEKLIDKIGRRSFDQLVDDVNAYITDGCDRLIPHHQRIAIAATAFQCLADYLREQDQPATPATLCDKIDWLPYAVDRQFPGYAGAKLLHMLAPRAAA